MTTKAAIVVACLPYVAASMAFAQVGDDCSNPIDIAGLPFAAVGDTNLFSDKYEMACLFGEPGRSDACDVVYRYTPVFDETVTIGLCRSAYDTELYVFEDICPGEGDALACSDDDCFGLEGRTTNAHISELDLFAGHTYFIIVDGYQDESGVFAITMESSACAECSDGAIDENEPNCGMDENGAFDDFTNGGCNSDPPVFMNVAHGDTICGTTASNPKTNTRDTDWFAIELDNTSRVSWIVKAEFRTLIGIVDTEGAAECSDAECFVAMTEITSCQPGVVSAILPAGTWSLYLAPFFQDEGACTFSYVASVQTRALADLNADGFVNGADLLILLGLWGPCPDPPAECLADLDFDGEVGSSDLIILLGSWT